MNDVQLKLSENGRGAFIIEENGERMAEMEIGISKGNLIVYHTEVNERLKNQGVGGILLDHMVTYARSNQLKVIPLCPFVNAQLRRHPQKYDDIWKKDWK